MPTPRVPYTSLTPEASQFDLQVPVRSSTDQDADVALGLRLSAKNGVWGRVDERWRCFVGRAWELLSDNAGLLLVASAQAFFAAMNVAVKILNSLDPPVPALELVAVRMGITWICCISYMQWKNIADPFFGPREVRWLLVFRGFSGFFGLFGVYYSLQYLSLSDATVLTFLAPFTTAIAGYFLLGEDFSRREGLAGTLCMLGVVLIARPASLFGAASDGIPDSTNPSEKGTPADRLVAVGVALIGVLGATGAYTSVRAIGKRAHPMHSMVSFSTQCVIVATISMTVLQIPPVFPNRFLWIVLLIMIGVFGFLAQLLLTLGLQRETAGRGTIAVYIQIVFASILERIFLHNIPSATSIAGTLVIMGSAIYVVVMKQTKQEVQKPRNEAPGIEESLELEAGLLEHDELDEDK